MRAQAIVKSTQDPSFAVDSTGVVVAWNDGAEQLLGHRASEVQGRQCWEILSGRDIFGNDYCGEGCPLLRMARSHRAVSRCELCLRSQSGTFHHVGISTIVVSGGRRSAFSIVHLLTEVAPDSECAEPFPWRLCSTRAASRLTAREAEVLSLLADGKGTTDIAELLFISAATVRNHIKNILGKLRVHSRLEAVSLAHRVGLLDSSKDDR